MPILEVKTTGSKEIWQSPDGQRRIHELQLEFEGKAVKANTFSDAIAAVGWEGKVETYERPGKGNAPAQTFVKQPPKEDGGYPSTRSIGGGGSSRTSYQPKDEKAIQAMWSIGQAVQLVVATKPKDILGTVEAHAQELFSMVDRVKVTPEDATEDPQVDPPMPDDFLKQPDVVITDVPEQAKLEDIKDIFDDADKAAEEVTVEDPWQPKG